MGSKQNPHYIEKHIHAIIHHFLISDCASCYLPKRIASKEVTGRQYRLKTTFYYVAINLPGTKVPLGHGPARRLRWCSVVLAAGLFAAFSSLLYLDVVNILLRSQRKDVSVDNGPCEECCLWSCGCPVSTDLCMSSSFSNSGFWVLCALHHWKTFRSFTFFHGLFRLYVLRPTHLCASISAGISLFKHSIFASIYPLSTNIIPIIPCPFDYPPARIKHDARASCFHTKTEESSFMRWEYCVSSHCY